MRHNLPSPGEDGRGCPKGGRGHCDGNSDPLRLSTMARVDAQALHKARALRRSETAAEIKLWEALRAKRLHGFKFVRQVPIGPYVADFACRSHMLIIEVDGATHGEEHEVEHDVRRTVFLEGQGWRVMRVWNADVFENLIGVCDSILLALKDR
jgi:very-short-patch-repair endonuclease